MGATPDLYLILVLFVSLNSDIKRASFVAWISGLCKELFSLTPFGVCAFLYTATGFIMFRSREFLFKDHAVTQILATFIAAVCYGTGYVIFLFLTADEIDIVSAAQRLLYSATYTAAVSPLLLSSMQRAAGFTAVK